MNRDRAFRDSARCWLAALGCAALSCAVAASSGCGFSQENALSVEGDAQASYYQVASTRVEYPTTEVISDDALMTSSPIDIDRLNGESKPDGDGVDASGKEPPIEYEYLTLQDAIHEALQNSHVLRDLGGVVLRDPGNVSTTYDVAVQELDPTFGVSAALSEFDAAFASSAFYAENDRALNNQFFGGGARILKQDTMTLESQVTKVAATGTQLKLLNHTDYDGNSAPGNSVPSAWTTWLDMEIRHPLMQGSGADFLRIAGTSNQPGNINGVVVARLRTDVSLTDFEMSVREFVSNVENAYWDLYFAYHDLDARLVARDQSLVTWNRINALNQFGKKGGEAAEEAQARAQYFRFQEQVQNALSGRLDDSTRTNNGSAGGSFRGNGGVMTSERRLRLLMARPANGNVLLRTKDDPIMSQVVFDWQSVLVEALTRRAELRRQKWIVKQRELELQAMHNFVKPTLDVVGRYRWRGFGNDLFDQNQYEGRFSNAVDDFLSGKFQEWQYGVELSFPFGNRRAHTAVEYAEVRLSRERVVLAEQEREVVHALSNAFAENKRAWSVLQTASDRREASDQQLKAVKETHELGNVSIDVLLDSQRRYQDAESNYYRALLEYTVAIRNMHFEKGSLLDYNEVYLTEDLWPKQAYSDALERRNNTHEIPSEWRYGLVNHPQPVSEGPYLQGVDVEEAAPWEASDNASASDESASDESASDESASDESASPAAPRLDVPAPAPAELKPVDPAAEAVRIRMPLRNQPVPETSAARQPGSRAVFQPATATRAKVLLPESFAAQVTAGFFAPPPKSAVIQQTSIELSSPVPSLPQPLPETNAAPVDRPLAPPLGSAR